MFVWKLDKAYLPIPLMSLLNSTEVLYKYFNKTSNKIDFFIDYNSNILIDNAFNKDGLICVDAFFDKKIVFHKNNILISHYHFLFPCSKLMFWF